MTIGIRCGRLLGDHRRLRNDRNDDVHIERNQLGGERGEPVELSVGEAVFDDDVFPFGIPEFAQPFPECVVAPQEAARGRAG